MSNRQTLGEHEIIQLMREHFTVMPNASVEFGDDISAVPLGDNGKVAVLKTDMLVAKTDVPKGMTFWQAARKAVVMNVSDFAAKGVQPQSALVSLGLPKGMLPADLRKLADGLNSGVREYNAYIVGGDTGEACDLIIAIELFGVTEKNRLMLRRGAKSGDILAVTGGFGCSSAGLRLLQNKELKASVKLHRKLLEAVYMPRARLAEGLALARSGAVSASMDSSDGLAWCLHELSSQSGVGFKVSSLPVSTDAEEFARQNGLDAADIALYGGEEYELVLTIKPGLWGKAEAAAEAVGGKLWRIGEATEGKRIFLSDANGEREIEARGYEHFKS